MNIEQEIQQPKFRNEYHKATINLFFTTNWLEERVRLFLEPADITTQQFNILRILRGSKRPLSTLQIRERMIDKMSDTSRLVDRLVKKQLVAKQTCTNDKRLVDVTITEKGLQLLASLDNSINNLDNILSNITTDEAETLNSLLEKIRRK